MACRVRTGTNQGVRLNSAAASVGWTLRDGPYGVRVGGREVACLCIPLTANIADSHKVGVWTGSWKCCVGCVKTKQASNCYGDSCAGDPLTTPTRRSASRLRLVKASSSTATLQVEPAELRWNEGAGWNFVLTVCSPACLFVLKT